MSSDGYAFTAFLKFTVRQLGPVFLAICAQPHTQLLRLLVLPFDGIDCSLT